MIFRAKEWNIVGQYCFYFSGRLDRSLCPELLRQSFLWNDLDRRKPRNTPKIACLTRDREESLYDISRLILILKSLGTRWIPDWASLTLKEKSRLGTLKIKLWYPPFLNVWKFFGCRTLRKAYISKHDVQQPFQQFLLFMGI